MAGALARTPLYERHAAAGARFAAFAGYQMPIQYESIVKEHQAVRGSAGLFDVSHMGEIRLRGRQALELSQRLFTNDLIGAEPGRVRYGMFCAEDGGVIDDVTAYRVAQDEVLFCVNASNTAVDLDWVLKVQAEGAYDCDVLDETESTALLAIQGPEARAITGRCLTGSDKPPGRWRFADAELAGVPVVLSRTGYTGEDGYEIYVASDAALAVWDALVRAGADTLSLAGLGARDTLRTEMAYPLYGHELDRDHTPLEADLERFLHFGAGFIGEAALQRQRTEGVRRRLVGLLIEGRGVARAGYPIVKDQVVGEVTSGTFSPSIERAIAIGYVPPELSAPDTALSVEVRGRALPCHISPTPFFHRKSS